MPEETLRIVLRGSAVRPDARLSVRMEPDWFEDHPCAYDGENQEWRVDVPLPAEEGVSFKFFCDGAWERRPDNRRLTREHLDDRRYEEELPGFAADQFAYRDDIPTCNSFVARQFFPHVDEREPVHLVVVGTGVGGGCLAHEYVKRLVARNSPPKRVLVLEAGGYLFPTHVGNLPRRQSSATDLHRHVWDLWGDFQSKRYRLPPGSAALPLAQAFCLGGRSLFWGALVPTMRPWEFRGWPAGLGNKLIYHWYAQAQDLVNRRQRSLRDHQRTVRERLVQAVPELSYAEAQIAAGEESAAAVGVPSGIFSTAALLLEDRLRETWRRHLDINLNHQVTMLETDGSSVRAVVAYDRVARRHRTFRLAPDGQVVLAAGTLGSPVIAQNSGIDLPGLGAGLTDHRTRFWKFTVPAGSPAFSTDEADKLVLRPPADPGPDGFNTVVEFGVNLNQSYWVDEDLKPDVLNPSTNMLCELVFFASDDLVDANTVTSGGPRFEDRPAVVMNSRPDDGFTARARQLGERILDAFGGQPLTDGPEHARPGAVGHEVGTMRMGTVVGPDLKVIGYDNLYVCDLSVFPTSPAANPSLTLAALAIRLAGQLP